MKGRLSLKERVSYGCGDFGLCLITTMVSTYMMYFYTNIVQIPVLQVGTITLIGGVVDAISDLLMGMLIDKTKTKLGKCRPYILAMAIPLAVIVFFAFSVPDASAQVKYIYALVTYLLYVCAYTAVCIPYQTLMSSITDRQDDRLSVNMWKTIGSSTGQFIISAFALTLVAVFGDGQQGFKTAAAIFGAAGAVLLLTCFKNTKERVTPPAGEKVELKDTLRSFQNLPWFLVCCTAFLALTAVVLRAQQTMFFAQYVMGDLGISSNLLTISTIVAIPVALVVPKLALKFGKRNLIIFGGIVYVLASVGMYAARESSMAVYLFAVLCGIGGSMPNSVCYVMTAEAIDYGEWKHGKRVQGALMSFIGFSVKVGGSIGSMIASMVLNAGGFVEGAETQSAAALQAVTINYIWLPVIMYIIIIILMLFYKLDKEYPAIREELEKRRQARTAEA